jgi:hypothetical protein
MYSRTVYHNTVISRGDDTLVVAAPLFDTALPLDWIEKHPEVEDFLFGRISEKELLAVDPSHDSLLTSLEILGCLTANDWPSSFTLKSARRLFRPLQCFWYKQYYSHPLWDSLRHGKLPKSGLLAWLLHNYHISQIAGRVDARLAVTRLGPAHIAKFFVDQSLEEYWHCDAFYFIQHDNLHLSPLLVKTHIPSPATIAFQQLTLNCADNDWLASLFICLFQESSIAFYDQCINSYEKIEKEYAIDGFFDSWKRHMQLDFEDSHAEKLEKLFDEETCIEGWQLRSALDRAWLAQFFLISALDEIFDGKNCNQFRLPLLAPESDLQPAFSAELCQKPLFNFFDAKLIFQEKRLNDIAVPTSQDLHADLNYLQGQLIKSIYIAMSRAQFHDSLIALGQIASGLKADPHQSIARNPWTCAIGNFFYELAVDAEIFLLVLLEFASRVRSLVGYDLIRSPKEKYTTSVVSNRALAGKELERALTNVVQVDELLQVWLREKMFLPAVLDM